MLSGTPLVIIIFLAIGLILLLTGRFKVHPFLALIITCFFLGLTVGMPLLELLQAMQKGFGDLMAYIGLIVIFGSIIGVFLERSGGALAVAQRLIEIFGRGKLVPGISSIGALVSIPVFCDSGFILLSGLTDKISRLSKESKATLSLALGTGLYTTHTLVPPTPGPIAAAGNIGATDFLGTIIITGFIISIPVLMATWRMSKILGNKITLETSQDDEVILDTQHIQLWKALLPILFPIGLIALGTILRFFGLESELFNFITAPLTAVFLGAIMGIFLLGQKESNANWLKEAIKISGPILIITGAGGAFGGVLKATPLKDLLGNWFQGDFSALVILIIIFGVAALLKTAQGSSTSAMVITSSLLAPLIPGLGWDQPIQYALAVMAIGGGSMTVSHYNDSYFWVVSQFSNIDAKDMIRSFTLLTGIQGIVVLICTMLAWVVLV